MVVGVSRGVRVLGSLAHLLIVGGVLGLPVAMAVGVWTPGRRDVLAHELAATAALMILAGFLAFLMALIIFNLEKE